MLSACRVGRVGRRALRGAYGNARSGNGALAGQTSNFGWRCGCCVNAGASGRGVWREMLCKRRGEGADLPSQKCIFTCAYTLLL